MRAKPGRQSAVTLDNSPAASWPATPLRVALIAACLGNKGGYLGGAERQVYYMARALADAGVEVRIYSLLDGAAFGDALRVMRVECRHFGFLPGLPLRLLVLLAGLGRFRPHIIQSMHSYTNVYSAVAGRLLGVPSIGGLRSDFQSCLRDNGRFARLLLTLPDAVAVNSRTAIEQVTEAGLVDPSRLHLLSNVIEMGVFGGPLPPAVRANRGECACICVTRLFPLKRVDVFLRALAAARAAEPGLRGMVVGFGPETGRLQRLAAALGLLPDAVRFLGPREDIADLLRQAAMFVFCSESEGTPNVILEAMAAGLPVITTPAGDAADVVEPAGAGYIVPFGDVDAVAGAMIRLARSPELRCRSGTAGRSYIARHRDAATLAGRLFKLYADVARASWRGCRADLLQLLAQYSGVQQVAGNGLAADERR
jgi:glycosyltransferase involved in cell wall biosynthesis